MAICFGLQAVLSRACLRKPVRNPYFPKLRTDDNFQDKDRRQGRNQWQTNDQGFSGLQFQHQLKD